MFLRTCRAALIALTAADLVETLSLLRQQREDEESNSSRSLTEAISSWSLVSSVSAGYSRGCYGAADEPKSTELLRSFEPQTPGEEAWVNLQPPREARLGTLDFSDFSVRGRTVEEDDSDETPRDPKLALLMVIKNEVLNENIWKSWMDQARADGLDFKIVLHASNVRQNETLSELFEPFRISSNVPTSWCDLWAATELLMEKAIEDKSVTNLVTISDNSVPLKPLRHIYKELAEKPQTRMCMDWHNGKLPRAETWWSMRRDDAELFVKNRQQARNTFRFENTGKCIDELAWAYPLLLRQSYRPDEETLLDQCVMFTDWLSSSSKCKQAYASSDHAAWSDHSALCDCEHLRGSPHVETNGYHPRTYSKVDNMAWQELRRSPFWFGRKFAKGAFANIKETWEASDGPSADQKQH